MPEYKSAMASGVFRSVFRSTVCITGSPICSRCLYALQCSYYTVFESLGRAERLPSIFSEGTLPFPFVLHPPYSGIRLYRRGHCFSIGLTLFGGSIRLLDKFIVVLQRMGELGLGRMKGRFNVLNIESVNNSGSRKRLFEPEYENYAEEPFQIDADRISADSVMKVSRVKIGFRTPLRIYEKGELILDPSSLTPVSLLSAMAFRYYSLAYLYGSGRCPESIELYADQISIQRNSMRINDWAQISPEKKPNDNFKGLTGWITLAGNLTHCHTLMTIAAHLNIGEHTELGMGSLTVNEEI